MIAALRRLALVVTLACSLAPASAEPLSIEDAFRPPQLLSMRLSPDGKWLVALGLKGSATAVLLIDAETLDAKPLYDAYEDPRLRATAAHRAGSDRVAVQAGFDVVVLDLSGEVKHRYVESRFHSSAAPDAEGHVRMVVQNLRFPSKLYRADVQTGRWELMTFDVPGHPVRWVLDREGAPLVVSTMDTKFWSDDTKLTHWWRPSVEAKWQSLATFAWPDVGWTPQSLLPDGKSLAVTPSKGATPGRCFATSWRRGA